jgi:hypothetical protein
MGKNECVASAGASSVIVYIIFAIPGNYFLFFLFCVWLIKSPQIYKNQFFSNLKNRGKLTLL